MRFLRINLKTELIRERQAQQALLNEVHRLLQESNRKDEDVLQRLRVTSSSSRIPNRLDSVDTCLVFDLAEIRQLCIRYRLRFLDSIHFKSGYPYSAIAEIRAFEKKYDLKIEQFYIAAPEESFQLEDINKDPLLFAQLDNGGFYLLHQWGKDLAWYKKYTLWPLQNFRNLFISLWILAAAVSFVIPSSIINILSFEGEIYLRIWLTIHTFIALSGFTIWSGLTFNKTVSSKNWNSKYYNY